MPGLKSEERATREGDAVKGNGEVGGAPEASGRHMSEPEGRGVAWTEERGTSDEGRRRVKRLGGERGNRVTAAAWTPPRSQVIAGYQPTATTMYCGLPTEMSEDCPA